MFPYLLILHAFTPFVFHFQLKNLNILLTSDPNTVVSTNGIWVIKYLLAFGYETLIQLMGFS
jgi:hypothetical protein